MIDAGTHSELDYTQRNSHHGLLANRRAISRRFDDGCDQQQRGEVLIPGITLASLTDQLQRDAPPMERTLLSLRARFAADRP